MSDDVTQKNARKGGCASSGCGCVALACLALLATGCLLVWILSRWEAAEKAWDRLPPDTVWALQAHDCRELLLTAARDPGAHVLLRRLDQYLDREHGPDTGGTADFLSAYEGIGFLHTLVAPNSFLVGGVDTDPDAAFLIFRSPVWLRWYAALPWAGLDAIREEKDDETGSVFFAARGGWMIVALRREMTERVLDNWDKRAMPLGVGYEGDDAHIAFAMRRKPAAKTPETPPREASHFTLADPFALPASATSRPAEPEGMFLRIVVRPRGDGWQGEGQVDGNGQYDGARSLAAVIRDVLGDAEANAMPPASCDAALSVRLSPEAREKVIGVIQNKTAETRGPEISPADLGRKWLREDWLANAGDVWTVLAARPAVTDAGLPYPPLPVFSVGWTTRPGVTPEAAADAFTNGLTQWVDSFRAEGGPPLLQNLRKSVSYALTPSPDNPGGELRVPPIMINAARPAWRFHLRSAPAAGWFATDPAGIPDAGAPGSFPAGEFGPPKAGHALFTCGWKFSDVFLDGLFAVVRDRLSHRLSAPDDGDAGRAADADDQDFLRVLRDAAGAYRQGSVHSDGDAGERRVLFRFAVPVVREDK